MNIQSVSDYNLEPRYCKCEWHTDECVCEHCHEHKAHNWRDWVEQNDIPCESCATEKKQCQMDGWQDAI